ncbi:MAG: UDP-N-acetylmuramate--L-alanine ligase [Patescibacteria group bacterium]|nr:UDP-N-acetylmuramate--L-alanine ligase [Patescibacteria group bacterium]
MDLSKISKIHFIGVGGIGVSAVAKMAKLLGKQVSGSDLAPTETTRELEALGIKLYIRHSADNVGPDVQLVVYSSAVAEDNSERVRAREIGAVEMSYFEFLGEYSREKFTIAISGTHGKSTVTAMLGKILADAGFDPTVIVGSKLKTFEYGNFRPGKSKYLVVEACEHLANFLHLNPNILVITNIEEDHLDYYRDLEDVAAAFQRLVDKLPEDGLLIYNGEDRASVELIEPRVASASFGFGDTATFQAIDIESRPGEQIFKALEDGEPLNSEFSLRVPGKFNISNALAAIAASDSVGADIEKIAGSLSEFPGLWRRQEVVGENNGAIIISDYGHHPTEIAATIQAMRDFYPGRRLVWVFQPHQHSRTKKLFNQFVKSFDGTDILLVADIFDVAGREQVEDQDINSKILAGQISGVSPNVEVHYSGDLQNTQKMAQDIIKPGDVVVFQGAGNIDDAARELINK